MKPLEQCIIDRIMNEGPLTFEAFMQMALYHPGMGYYSSPQTTIGRDGDFYTSPHLHPVFGAMIGRQLMEMWMIMGRPLSFDAVEIGAGAGYLSRDIFDYLFKPSGDPSTSQDKSDFVNSLRYIIVEPYDHFQERQEKLLKDLAEISKVEKRTAANKKISWVKSVNELDDIKGCIFSNELLDAFPVRLVEMEDKLKEIYVDFDGQKIIEQKLEICQPNILNYLNEFNIDIPIGYRTEINLKIKDWLEEISEVLTTGFLLTIDYGYTAEEYYDEERNKGTLLCYYKHRINENPYGNIGEQDITAHVNFSSLKKWGEEFGLKTTGYCPQGTFLISLGIDEAITEIYGNSPDYSSEILNIKNLILPQGMGETHRVMVQYKGEGIPPLRGFSLRNHASTL